MRTVRLHGELAEKFGACHRFAISSPAEAVCALTANFRGFERHLLETKGVAYKVIADDTPVGYEELSHPISHEVHIIPVIGGASSGRDKLIVGGLLIVAGAAINFYSGGSLAWLGTPMIQAGIAFAVSGVAQLLTPVPKSAEPPEQPDNKPSYNFNGPINTTAQGQPVPIGYGRLIVGGAVISAGIVSEEIPI